MRKTVTPADGEPLAGDSEQDEEANPQEADGLDDVDQKVLVHIGIRGDCRERPHNHTSEQDDKGDDE